MQISRNNFISVVLCGLTCLAGSPSSAQTEWRFSDIERFVAVADVHGAYTALETILKQATVIDPSLAWSGGRTHLVIVGDALDRGPESRNVLDLVMRLQSEALAAGGRVHFVLGNHEMMNLTGDLRYVSDAEYAAFAADEHAADRAAAFERFVESTTAPADETQLRAQFDARYPVGYFAHRRAFAPDGIYGAWLLRQPLLLVIDDWAFVHAGLADASREFGAEGINRQLTRQLADYSESLQALIAAGILSPLDDFYDHPAILTAFDARVQSDAAKWPEGLEATANRLRELNTAFVFAPDSPAWYRGNVACSMLTEKDRLLAALDAVGASRLVVGHTPTDGAIVQSRMDRSLLRIDTGMLHDYYGGRAAALVVAGSDVSVLYENQSGAAEVQSQPRRVGPRPQGMSTEDLESFLSTAQVIGQTDLDGRWRRIALRAGDLQLDGYFTAAARADFRPDVAAYRLDRMLNLDMVPVTVAREIDGVSGSLQYAPAGVITEEERATRQLGGSAWCPLSDQVGAMYVFDTLISNQGRTIDRINYNANDFQLILVGHDVAFSTDRDRPDHLKPLTLALTPAWIDALQALDEAQLTQSMGDVLDRRRIRALLARRDGILKDAIE
jgi:hypothetical protein